jgi:hypothetical protein
MEAAGGDSLDMMKCLVTELGADVDQVFYDGLTTLIATAHTGFLDVLQCLVALGASVDIKDNNGNTALLISARAGHFPITQYLIEHTDADIEEVNDCGETVYDHLILHIERGITRGGEPAALTALLRVLVLRSSLPDVLTSLLSLNNQRVVQEGVRIRARLPSYRVERRKLFDEQCNLLLPPIRDLVGDYMQLTITDDIWATLLCADFLI